MAKNDDLLTLDLEQFAPELAIESLDLADFLFQGLILKEKDFRQDLEELDFSRFLGKILAVHCSTDAIIAPWAWLLVGRYANRYCDSVEFGTKEEVYKRCFLANMDHFDWQQFTGKRVLVKGCSTDSVPADAYLKTSMLLAPLVRALNYGEACSFVPILKNSRAQFEQA